MYRCLIVDDEELARELIETHLKQLDDFELVASCNSAIEASKVLQQQSIDLLFLDIEMPVLNGTDFFKNLIVKPHVIFTTAYRDYALDGFELNAVDYLLKPITFSRFFMATEKFVTLQNTRSISTEVEKNNTTQKDDFIFIREDRKQVKVFYDDILYIESVKDYIKIHLSHKTRLIKYSLTAFEDRLDERFIRTHRSYIVNRDKITAYTKQDIEIDAIEIPIGENYKKNISDL
ncbi:LytTR family two component transcriptional regulator [Aquimarina sp. MAR_2010_214]|uniref:LytR/AlgR family response regulator transcription factor n=1 Tax=Aquimarina sp. MAR_2010_214 TaxID=1250026 RepID=UPI000CB7C9EB|nr:LytTR family DNA-binding domain-containing protein [Aquimarina sp. MAR_2010_214]PKV51303.1 LytTR family two component transcriptional regulator [Aquimarina sp. MAR_2010_214]